MYGDGNLGVWTDKSDDQTYMANDLISMHWTAYYIEVTFRQITTTEALSEGVTTLPTDSEDDSGCNELLLLFRIRWNRPDVDVSQVRPLRTRRTVKLQRDFLSVPSFPLIQMYIFGVLAQIHKHWTSRQLMSGLDMSSVTFLMCSYLLLIPTA